MPELRFRASDGSAATVVVTIAAPDGFPDTSNTGVRDWSRLRPVSTGMEVFTAGAVVENVDSSRYINVRAPNVTIRNSRFRAVDFYPVRVFDGIKGTVLEDVEIDGKGSASSNAGLAGSPWVGRRLNIHHVHDGAKLGSDCVLEDSYVHDLLTSAATPHYDCLQATGTGRRIRISRCNLRCGSGPGYTSAIILKTDFGPIDDVLIEDCLIGGGGFTVYSRDGGKGYGAPTNVRLHRNRFSRDFTFGLFSVDGSIEKVGNVWDDTGRPV